jgi:hypothetical protein
MGIVPTLGDVERLALELTDSQRAVVAARLLASLRPVLHDEDEGIAEALRRDFELESGELSGMSLEQLDKQVQQRGRR